MQSRSWEGVGKGGLEQHSYHHFDLFDTGDPVAVFLEPVWNHQIARAASRGALAPSANNELLSHQLADHNLSSAAQ